MNIKKSLLLMSLALLINLLCHNIGTTQTKRPDETIFLSGPVKEVSWNHKTIIVNDKKFFIYQDTIVVDQRGNELKLEDIKQDGNVAIDAIKIPSGYAIKKIVVITDKGV